MAVCYRLFCITDPTEETTISVATGHEGQEWQYFTYCTDTLKEFYFEIKAEHTGLITDDMGDIAIDGYEIVAQNCNSKYMKYKQEGGNRGKRAFHFAAFKTDSFHFMA